MFLFTHRVHGRSYPIKMINDETIHDARATYKVARHMLITAG